MGELAYFRRTNEPIGDSLRVAHGEEHIDPFFPEHVGTRPALELNPDLLTLAAQG